MSEKEKVEKFLRDKGVKIFVGGCGCCGSPWIHIDIDGEIVKIENETIDTLPDA